MAQSFPQRFYRNLSFTGLAITVVVANHLGLKVWDKVGPRFELPAFFGGHWEFAIFAFAILLTAWSWDSTLRKRIDELEKKVAGPINAKSDQ